MENTEKKGIFVRVYDWFKNLTVKGLLGFILVAFIIIIILSSVTYLPSLMGRISNSLSAALYSVFIPAEGATVVADKKVVNSGEDFNITFKKGDTANGIFTVSYDCDTSTSLFSVETSGLKKITCNTPYYLLENETSIKIRPVTETSVVRLAINAAMENNDTQKTESVGVIRLTVTNNSANPVTAVPTTTPAVVTTGTTTTTPAYVPPVYQPVYVGKPDLAVRLLQVGLLNTGTNMITNNQTSFNYTDTVGIRFEIRNDGDVATGPWVFSAILPSISTPTYNSYSQISLKPGESIIFTLGFSNLSNQNIGSISITADPLNVVTESNEYNNTITSTITNNSFNSNYYNNNNYNNNSNSGCYVNGFFTYNCGNTNYNNNWNYSNSNNINGYYDTYGNFHSYNNSNNNNNNGYYDSYGNFHYYNNNNSLSVNCYADPSDPIAGERVRWYANATGGNGDYSYDWTGTNSLNSTSQNPSKTYTSSGTKYATVSVSSNGYDASYTCSVFVD